MDYSNINAENIVQDDQDKEKIQTQKRAVISYIDTVLTKSRDDIAERLNLNEYPSSSVQAQPIDASVTAGITAALRFNQWFIAATLCIMNVTEKFYLPKKVFLDFLHRVLQTHDNSELSKIMSILKDHICLHPPSYPKDELQELYTSLLVDECREMLHGNKKSASGLVEQVITELEQICQSERVDSDSDIENDSPEDTDKKIQDIIQLPLSELVLEMESHQVYKELSDDDKLFRLGLVLDFAVTILEQDFLAWHRSSPRWSRLYQTLKNHNKQPIIVALAWPRGSLVGTCNTFCRRVTQIIWSGKLQDPLLRLLKLLAEVMSISDSRGCFPEMRKMCSTLARNVSLGMSKSAEGLVQQAYQLKPDWLALLVVHKAVTKVIRPGNVGMPSLDLVEACMALVNHGPVMQSDVKPGMEIDLELAEPPAKINKRSKTGETRLHIACKRGNVAEIKRLLQQPHIDVNIADNAGWTPLHEAIVGGKESVETLLRYRSPSGIAVDVRAKDQYGMTPLMDAVDRGKLDICEVLLKNSGWCLLEDARMDGLKAENLASSPEIQAILTASRLGERNLMYNSLRCDDLPVLATLLPAYLKLYLSTYKLHSVVWKMMSGEAQTSNVLKGDSKLFNFLEAKQSLDVLANIQKAAVPGSQFDEILSSDMY